MNETALSALRISALVGVGSTVLCMPPAILCGYLFATRRFRGRAVAEAVLLLPLVLPPVVTGFALLALFGARGPIGGLLAELGMPVVFTWRACVLAGAVMAFPLAYRVCRTAFEGVDPRLVGVARTLGASRLDAFVSVALPLARPGIVAGALLAFARSVGEFGATIVLAGNVEGETRTLPIAVFQELNARGTDGVWPLALLSALLAVGALVAGELFVRRETP